MSTTVFIGWIPVVKDYESNPAVASLKELKVAKQATPGLEHSYRGTGTDPNEPKAIEPIDVWSSPDAAKAFAASSTAAEIKGHFDSIIDSSNPKVRPFRNVFTLNGDFLKAAEAPVTEFAATFVATSVSTADFEAAYAAALKAGGAPPDGFIAGAHGWGSEEIDHPLAGKSKVFLSVSGWESDAKANAAQATAEKIFEPLKQFAEHYHVRTAVLSKEK